MHCTGRLGVVNGWLVLRSEDEHSRQYITFVPMALVLPTATLARSQHADRSLEVYLRRHKKGFIGDALSWPLAIGYITLIAVVHALIKTTTYWLHKTLDNKEPQTLGLICSNFKKELTKSQCVHMRIPNHPPQSPPTTCARENTTARLQCRIHARSTKMRLR